jgi:enamine deaminase RidA (YjgF/YER057c/UK114 family)
MTPEARIQQLGLELPPAPAPVGLYVPVVVVDNMAFLSGHGPLRCDGTFITGRVGAELDWHGGYEAARQTALAMLATLRSSLGSLDRVRRVVRIAGFVNCPPDFDQQPAVINGASELFRDVFGTQRGVGARMAMGSNALPNNIAVEIDGLFQVAPA